MNAAAVGAIAPEPWTPQRLMLLAAVALGIAGGFAALFVPTMALFLKPMVQEFGWGRGSLVAMTVFALVGMALGAPVVGRLIDRRGAARVIGVAVLLHALALAAMSQLPPRMPVLAAVSFVAGLAGVATTPLGWLTLLPAWFERRLGLALGITMVGLGLGALAATLGTERLIAQFGWRGAYLCLAALALAAGAGALALLSRVGAPPLRSQAAGPMPRAVTLDAGSTAGPGLDARTALRTPRFWALVAIVFVVSMAGLGLAVHSVALFTDRGLTSRQAAQVAAFAHIGLTAGRLATGALLDRVFGPFVACGAFVLGALGLAITGSPAVVTFWPLAVGAFLGGLLVGAEGDIIPFFVRRYFGIRAYGSVYGLAFLAYALGGVVGPMVYGIAFDRAGSYDGVIQAAGWCCLLAAGAVLGLGRYVYPAQHHATSTPRLTPARRAP